MTVVAIRSSCQGYKKGRLVGEPAVVQIYRLILVEISLEVPTHAEGSSVCFAGVGDVAVVLEEHGSTFINQS